MNSPWRFLELQEVGVSVLDCEHKTPPDAGIGHPYVAIPNLVDGRLELASVRRITDKQLGEWTRRTRPQSGDIIVTRRGRVGDSAVVPDGLQCAIGQNLVILRSDGGRVTQGYLRWVARGPLWEREVNRLRNVGAVFDSLNVRDVGRIRIPVPPLREQQAIAEVLGVLDDKIELGKRISRTAQALAAAVWSAASRRGSVRAVTETTLGRLVDEGALYFSDGYRTKQSELGDPGVPVLRVADVLDGRLIPSRKDCVLEELRVKFAHKVSQPGDVVLTTKGSIGRIAMIPGSMQEFVYSPQLCFFRVHPGSTLDRHWLYGWFRGPEFRERAAAVQHQTDMAPYINLVDLRGTRITLPPPHVQRRTGDLIAPLEETAQAALYESDVLASLRDTLLPRLLSGELRVGDVEELAEEAM